MEKRLFRREHPILTAFLVVGATMLLMFFGITFFISMLFWGGSDRIRSHGDGVGVVEIKGVIVSPDEILAQLAEFRQAERVKAIVLRIDSPGGTVGAAQEIFEEVRKTDRVKPVVASMASVAASGGYYVALGARQIIANPGTLTGSMGVILKLANLEELFRKIGYEVEVVKSGELKDMGSANRALTSTERAVLQAMLDDVHQQFIAAIASSRSLPEDKISRLADGRLFSGRQAKEHGLIDSFGNLRDAALIAARLGGLEDAEPKLIYPVSHDFSLLKLLTGKRNQAVASLVGINNPGIAYEWTALP